MDRLDLQHEPSFDATTQELATGLLKECEISSDPIFDSLTPEQLTTIKDMIYLAIGRGIDLGRSLSCDHYIPTIDPEQQADEEAFEHAIGLAEIDGYHRGFLDAYNNQNQGEQ